MTSWAILPGLWNSSVTQEEGVIRTHLGQPCPPVALARATFWPACFWYVAHTVSSVYSYFPCPPSHSSIWLYDLPINLPKYPSICLRCPEQAALACNKTPSWYNYWSITEQFLAVIKKMKGEAKIINYQVNLNHIQILFMFFKRWHWEKSSGLWVKRSWVQELTLPFTMWPWVKHLISKNLHFLIYRTRIKPSHRYVLRTTGDYFHH